MQLFGLAAEGVTDFAVIESILCGFYDYDDLEDEINQLQPAFDATNQKQIGFGNWTLQLEYLKSERFREDVINHNYIIVQVDTDIAGRKGFDVNINDDNSRMLPVDDIVERVIQRLIQQINSAEEAPDNFFHNHAEKIIFCISVQSIECWLYAHYVKRYPNNPKVVGCERALSRCQLPVNHKKEYPIYQKLSEPLLNKNNLTAAAGRDPSLNIFLQKLDQIEPDVSAYIDDL